MVSKNNLLKQAINGYKAKDCRTTTLNSSVKRTVAAKKLLGKK